MVAEAILGALVGGGFAVAGSVVQAWFNRQNTKDRIEAENQRLKAEIYAGEKVEVLSQLHSQFAKCRQIISKQLGRRAEEMTEEEVQREVISRVDSLQVAVDKALIFFDDEQMETISDAYLSISSAGEYLEKESQGESHRVPETESSTLIKNTNAAMEILRDEINGPIETFESS